MMLPLMTTIRIFPERLMGMLLWGMACGAGMGILYDVFRISRVFLGVRYPSRTAEALYCKPLPLIRRPVPQPSSERRHMLWASLRYAVIFVEDVLFGVTWGAVMVLLVYFTNDGQFRAMAPVGMLVGFLAYDQTVGRLVLSLSQGIVFLLRAACCYAVALILLPPRVMRWFWRHTLGAFLVKRIRAARERRAEAYREAILRELTASAERGWLMCDTWKVQKKKGGRQYAKTRKSQEDDDGLAECQVISDADRGVCHRLFCDQADGKQQAEKRA